MLCCVLSTTSCKGNVSFWEISRVCNAGRAHSRRSPSRSRLVDLTTTALQADPNWSRFQAGATGSGVAAATVGTDAADAPGTPPTPSASSERSNAMDELSSEALAPLHPADAAAEQPDSTPAPVETPARAVRSAEEQEVTTPAEAGAAAAAEASPLPVEGLCGDTTPAACVGQRWDEQTPATSVVQRHVLGTPGSRAGTVFFWLRASLTPSWRKQVGGCRAQSSELHVISVLCYLGRLAFQRASLTPTWRKQIQGLWGSALVQGMAWHVSLRALLWAFCPWQAAQAQGAARYPVKATRIGVRHSALGCLSRSVTCFDKEHPFLCPMAPQHQCHCE